MHTVIIPINVLYECIQWKCKLPWPFTAMFEHTHVDHISVLLMFLLLYRCDSGYYRLHLTPKCHWRYFIIAVFDIVPFYLLWSSFVSLTFLNWVSWLHLCKCCLLHGKCYIAVVLYLHLVSIFSFCLTFLFSSPINHLDLLFVLHLKTTAI